MGLQAILHQILCNDIKLLSDSYGLQYCLQCSNVAYCVTFCDCKISYKTALTTDQQTLFMQNSYIEMRAQFHYKTWPVSPI